jgi:uncharacterized protein
VNLQFKGQEIIPKSKDVVWNFITKPENIAKCLPDVTDYKVHDDKTFDATVQVAVGPVRGKFVFKVALDPQPGGDHMNLKIGGGGFGSVVDLLASADLKDNDSSTLMDWQGMATMRGPVAGVGGRVLDAQAQRVIGTTFSNIKARVTDAAAHV